MKRAILGLVAVAILVLLGILGWYMVDTRQAEARSNDFESWAKNQKMVPIEFVVTAPAETPADQPLFVSGNAGALGAWDGAGVRLEKQSDGKYHGTVELMSGIDHAFKITRGTWGTVERAADGGEIPNHTLTAEKPQTVDVAVATWVDGGKAVPGRVTLSGLLQQHKKFHSSELNNERTIIVYLPPGYEDASNQATRYPVLYMQDGQNLFDESTSFAGIEWKVDEAAQRLIAEGKIEPLIIVGIYNSEQRNEEFTPPALSTDKIKGRGDAYARFVVNEVKPMIDRTYRTMPERAHTALAGSSMGGLITLYMAKVNHDQFAAIGVLTPWLREGNKTLPEAMGDVAGWTKNLRVYMEMGSAGGANYPGDKPMDDAKALVKVMESAGMASGRDFVFAEVQNGEHNEAAWSSQVEPMLIFLFPKP
jgi:predicted alpha/beta superfamily hydrolase